MEFGRFDELNGSILGQGGVRGYPSRRHRGYVRERAESSVTQDLGSNPDPVPFRAESFHKGNAFLLTTRVVSMAQEVVRCMLP